MEGPPLKPQARPPATPAPARRLRGRRAEAGGRAAETMAERALLDDGWTILARRLRNAGGELDLVVRRDGLLCFVEVKARPSLAEAAFALTPRQQARLRLAAEIALAEHPDWAVEGCRFDVIVVDPAGQLRRITDAIRD
ncbi:putative endonuclease [Endobacter medicaginis]|uniref:UPF0102 protein FHR90_000517 n=3 Tax=Endobacter medicaginis TaxID=1181271 RepID=A0A839UWF2_9PROT|nr:YraN family protein [Endobacter medicaginis]MBB3172703.1 putative endonuclease [Endobacter medicaginis]MCX5474310.1 YraN family protein [Endobacter medicaginis]